MTTNSEIKSVLRTKNPQIIARFLQDQERAGPAALSASIRGLVCRECLAWAPSLRPWLVSFAVEILKNCDAAGSDRNSALLLVERNPADLIPKLLESGWRCRAAVAKAIGNNINKRLASKIEWDEWLSLATDTDVRVVSEWLQSAAQLDKSTIQVYCILDWVNGITSAIKFTSAWRNPRKWHALSYHLWQLAVSSAHLPEWLPTWVILSGPPPENLETSTVLQLLKAQLSAEALDQLHSYLVEKRGVLEDLRAWLCGDIAEKELESYYNLNLDLDYWRREIVKVTSLSSQRQDAIAAIAAVTDENARFLASKAAYSLIAGDMLSDLAESQKLDVLLIILDTLPIEIFDPAAATVVSMCCKHSECPGALRLAGAICRRHPCLIPNIEEGPLSLETAELHAAGGSLQLKFDSLTECLATSTIHSNDLKIIAQTVGFVPRVNESLIYALNEVVRFSSVKRKHQRLATVALVACLTRNALQRQLLKILRKLIDHPVVGDIVTLGWVQALNLSNIYAYTSSADVANLAYFIPFIPSGLSPSPHVSLLSTLHSALFPPDRALGLKCRR